MIVKRIIEQRLSTTIFSMSRLSGGDINSVYSLKTAKGNFVVKLNDKESLEKADNISGKLISTNFQTILSYAIAQKI